MFVFIEIEFSQCHPAAVVSLQGSEGLKMQHQRHKNESDISKIEKVYNKNLEIDMGIWNSKGFKVISNKWIGLTTK